MKKHLRAGYLASSLLPLVAISVLMLRLFDPYSRAIALGLYLLGCVALWLSVRRHARIRGALSQVKSHAMFALSELGLLRKRAAAAFFVFAICLVLFPILLPSEQLAFLSSDVTQIEKEFTETEEQLSRSERGLTIAGQRMVLALGRLTLQNRAARDNLRSAWTQYLDHAVVIDRLITTHKHFYQLAPRSSDLADRGFLIGYRALVLQLGIGHYVTQAVGGSAHIESILNEPSSELGLGRDTYLKFTRGLAQPENLVQLEAGLAYLRLLRAAGHLSAQKVECERIDSLGAKTVKLFGRDASILLDSPLDVLEKRAFVAWFPLQKGTAELISPVRTKHRDNFISEKDLAWARERLHPGDILLERRDWYLTNLGIPGFWPHAALYVGTLAELDEEFGEEARSATLGLAPSVYLRTKMPKVYAALSQIDEAGHLPRVIEAVGEGVIVQSFETSGHADYMAALRPRLPDTRRLAAVIEAFRHYGKPYDYNFEFSTDETLVCSELVYKALSPVGNEPGILFQLSKQNGRFLLPPNDIARTFDEQCGKANQQLDYIFFLDGNDRVGRATFNDEAAFRASWKRPRWQLKKN